MNFAASVSDFKELSVPYFPHGEDFAKRKPIRKRHRRADEIYLHEFFSAYSLFSTKMKKWKFKKKITC